MTEPGEIYRTGAPMSLPWRMLVTHFATQLFTASRSHPTVTEVMPTLPALTGCERETDQPTTSDLLEYLRRKGMPEVSNHSGAILGILNAMTSAGMLYDWGRVAPRLGPLGHTYWTMNLGPPRGAGGDLWMSQLFGAELIVPSYGSVTVPISGTSKRTGEPDIGSGLVIDSSHILTNAHVVEGLQLAPEITPPKLRPPTRHSLSDNTVRVVSAKAHPSIDVGVIEVTNTAQLLQPAGEKNGRQFLEAVPLLLKTLPDLIFREPAWSDETYVFGYPPVPMAAEGETPLVVQRGEVVNPSVADRHGNNFFLFSATARPGNSGGPVVSQDGYVLGLVAQLSTWKLARQSDAGDALTDVEAPFYGGVPSSQITTALNEIGYGGLIEVDTGERTAWNLDA